LTAAFLIAVLTTTCCAWRWTLVSRGLGIAVPLRTAIAAYYRSQFLNSTVPGGVTGDVHRAVRHGREVGHVGLGVRAVVWERCAGQCVQLVITIVVVLLMTSPVRPAGRTVVTACVLGALVVAVSSWALARLGPSRLTRIARTVADDVRRGVLARAAWPGIVLASAVVVAGHTATFLLAARSAGSTASLARLLPLALLVLLAMTVPTSIGGWGPREGAAAWAFGAAGLGAGHGVATAVVYGVMVLVATLPGAGVLLADRLRRRPSHADRSTLPRALPALAGPDGGRHG
jgi:uncharacterized membrane protein YbhN (UPF0104 family)